MPPGLQTAVGLKASPKRYLTISSWSMSPNSSSLYMLPVREATELSRHLFKSTKEGSGWLLPLQVYQEATVLIAMRVTGEEEVPEGVVAVLTPDAPDVLSHVSVRARNLKVVILYGIDCKICLAAKTDMWTNTPFASFASTFWSFYFVPQLWLWSFCSL